MYIKKHINEDNLARGTLSDINAFQYENYLKFKELLIEKNVVENFIEYDAFFLLRFLRARKFDLQNTLKMFTNYLDWVKSVDLKRIVNTNYPYTKEILKAYPKAYHKTDKLGRPIYFEIISLVNFSEVMKYCNEDILIEMTIKDNELYLHNRLPACSKVAGKPIEQSLSILCAKDVSLAFTIKVKKIIQKNTNISQDYYPEMLGNLFIINTGIVFRAIWNLVKGFIDEKTKRKIAMLGSDYLDVLKKHIDMENLPTFLGGKCTCSHVDGGCLFGDVGPWNPPPS